MAQLPPRKPSHGAGHADGSDLLQILVFRKTLTRDQAERVRKQARAGALPLVATIVKLGLKLGNAGRRGARGVRRAAIHEDQRSEMNLRHAEKQALRVFAAGVRAGESGVPLR